MEVARINAAGGINGRQIQLIIEDDATDAAKAQAAATKLIDQDKVAVLIGATAVTHEIQEAHATTPFTVAADCSVTGLAWAPATIPAPIFPPIYAGLGAPFDTFTVRFSGLVFPWANDNWRLTYVDGTTIISPTRGGVFPSPATGARSCRWMASAAADGVVPAWTPCHCVGSMPSGHFCSSSSALGAMQ
jgi:hypothetical protein